MDHDQRFKVLIQTFFLEFLLLFFKPWADRLEATAVELLALALTFTKSISGNCGLCDSNTFMWDCRRWME
jgi:hypothetical protein